MEKSWTDARGVVWPWIDARGYPYIRRSGPLYHCTACNKSGGGHQHPRHSKSQEHADKVLEVERAAALRAAGGGAAAADGGAAVVHRVAAAAGAAVGGAAAARTRVHTAAPAAAAAAAAVDIRSLTPSPAPKAVTPQTVLVLNGMQPFVRVPCLIRYRCRAERLCTYVGRRSGRQCSCRITRDEPHFGKEKKTGLVSCRSCWHALGSHPDPIDRAVGSPPARSAAARSAAPCNSPSAAAAAAALVTIRGAAADAADADDVEVLEPIGEETRNHYAQLSSRNTTHGVRRAAAGNPTRVQLTIMHYELTQPLLAAFVAHLKVKHDRQPVQVLAVLAAARGCVC